MVIHEAVSVLAFGALRGSDGIPLHTGLIPAALAHQNPCAAVATRDGQHGHVVKAVIRAADHTEAAAMFASISFIHAA